MKPDVVEVYAMLRRDHPARPLPRDMEEWMILEVVRLRVEVHAERAAVVAWLRERQPGWPAGSGGHADSIERGEHRREDVASAEDDDDEDPSSSWRFCEGCGCRKENARYRSWSDHAWCSDCTSRE